ncbi:hypothetical protein PR048_005814, partial [Dryococelus australis]
MEHEKMNPTDMASRGRSAEWEGPEWLNKAPFEWPVSSCVMCKDECNFLGWVMGFIHKCQHPENNKTGELDAAELGNLEEHTSNSFRRNPFIALQTN